MRIRGVVSGVIAVILCAGVPAGARQPVSPAPRQTASAATSIADLAWLEGTWQTAAGRTRRVEEHWTAPAGGTMLGVSRTITGDTTTEFEFLRIVVRDGRPVYVAQPGGRHPGTEFPLTTAGSHRVVFENPEHDFPKRITYQRDGDRLVARVDAGEGTRAVVFEYTRTAR